MHTRTNLKKGETIQGYSTPLTWGSSPNEGTVCIFWDCTNKVRHGNVSSSLTTVYTARIICSTLHMFLINLIMEDPPIMHNIIFQLFLCQEIVQLVPHYLRESKCIILDTWKHDRYVIVTWLLHPITTIEVLIEYHKSPRHVLAILSLNIYYRELPDGVYCGNFDMNLTAGWASQVFKIRITDTYIWIIIHYGYI